MSDKKSKKRKQKIEIATPEETAEFGQDPATDGPTGSGRQAESGDAPEQAEQSADDRAEQPIEERPPETALQRAERERDEFRDKWLRAKAEDENRAKRLAAERQEAVRYAIANLARSALNVVDDLERTLEASAKHDDATSLAEGVRIVYDHLLKVLRDHHIERVEAVGRPFDPQIHEALTQQPSTDHPAGTVLREIQKGYRLHERVLRPARVIVSCEPPDESQAENDTEDE